MAPVNSLAFTTLVLSWLFVGLACLSVAAILTSTIINSHSIRTSEIFLVASLVVGIVLVAQTTWAIVDEGGGKHQRELSNRRISELAKVRTLLFRSYLSKLT
jgi:hypothetical protein